MNEINLFELKMFPMCLICFPKKIKHTRFLHSSDSAHIDGFITSCYESDIGTRSVHVRKRECMSEKRLHKLCYKESLGVDLWTSC